jgi:hypothetical protein
MGMGDDIMATAQAKAIYKATGHKVHTGNYFSPVWEGNPYFAGRGEQYIKLENRPGHRPYILGQTKERFIWNPNHRAAPGDLYPKQDSRGAGKIVIEPNVKGTVSASNKDWGFDKWQEVVNTLDKPFLQMGSGPWLDGVERIETATFMDAVAVLSKADLFVGTDGGMHHAAAAMGIPAVVVWGGYASPEMLGYDIHTNIALGSEYCGSKNDCSHCRELLDEVTVDMVKTAITEAI